MMNKLTNNILVIDDDPFTLKLIDRMLKNLGYSSVMLCDSGRAALKQLKAICILRLATRFRLHFKLSRFVQNMVV